MPLTRDPAVWWAALKGVWHDLDDRNITLISAGVAFYGILALFPGLAATIAIWGLVADPAAIDEQIALMRGLLPAEVYDIIDAQIESLSAARSTTLGWTTALSIALALWSARNGVSALMRGLNSIYRERNRGGLRHTVSALVLTAALIGVGLVATATVVVAPLVLAVVPMGDAAGLAVQLVRWLVAIGVLTVGLGIVYRYGPNRRGARVPWITPGAVLAVVLWAAASAAFSVYLSNFGNYNEVYGSIGAAIALLMWLYISAFLILLGASLNAHLELRTRQGTTVGPGRPPARRGAQLADRYVDSGS